jgi:hypothetical protein
VPDKPEIEEPTAEEPIPKLPRAPLFRKLSLPAMVRIGMFAALLYAVVVLREPCADSVGRFVGGFDDPPDAGPASILDRYPGYELMTAEEALKRWPDAPDGGPEDAGSESGADSDAEPQTGRRARPSRSP